MRSIKILLMHHRISGYTFVKVKVRFEGVSMIFESVWYHHITNVSELLL